MSVFGHGSIAIVVVVVSLTTTAAGADLAPRRVLPKPEHITQPAFESQLVVKFNDPIRARATDDGRVVSIAGANLEAIDDFRQQFQVSFSQLIRLPQERIDLLEERAAGLSGVAQPDLAGMMRVNGPQDQLEDVANALLRLEEIEWVSFEETTPVPPGGGCGDIPPTTPLYHSRQTYHGPNPGLNMTAAWDLGNARGGGVKIADCEYGYVMGHEDLCGIIMEKGQTIHPRVVELGWDEHGTAVFGEMISTEGAFGCHGLALEAEGYFFTEWSVEEGRRRATCIANAIASVDPGDIVVLEMQTTGQGGGYGPAELNESVWTLVRNAGDANILVVAAAGNGNQNLDSAPYAEYRARGDSGSIIVGAGTSDLRHDKLSFSTYGSRVNVQGWGHNVFTLGYGSYAEHGGDKNQRYTASFSGTSSATPFVASACAALQSFAEAELGRRLLPLEMREVLVETGIPQGSGGHIGPFPDVYAAALVVASRGGSAELIEFEIVTGDLLDGTIEDLRRSDDSRVRTRSGFGEAIADLHKMEMMVNAVTAVDSPSTLDLAVEARIDEPSGTARLFLRNRNTGLFDQVGQYSIGMTEETFTIEDIDAADYVGTSGEIDLMLKHNVFRPFLGFTFESFTDWVEIVVK